MAVSWDKKNGIELRIHENSDGLSTDLAEYIAALSEASVKERGVFAIALSGGSLISLMRKLSEAPFNKTVEWARWHIFLADERVVAKSHIDSNYKLLKDTLLAKVAKDPSGKNINALEQHIKNLLSPSTPHFFNTLYDPYREAEKVQTLFAATLSVSVSVKVFRLLFLMAYGSTSQIMMHLLSLSSLVRIPDTWMQF